MIPPDLLPKARADYDRTSKWAEPYYKQWAQRVRAELEADKRAGIIPDEFLNDLSEGEEEEDEEMMAMRRHVPTPLSMPSSPVMSSAPKPVKPIISIPARTHFDQECQEDGISPVDIHSDIASCLDELRWQAPKSARSHRSAAGQAKSLSVLTRSRTNAKSRYSQPSSTGAVFGRIPATKTIPHSSSSRSRFPRSLSSVRRSDSAGLTKVRRGRVTKRHHCI